MAPFASIAKALLVQPLVLSSLQVPSSGEMHKIEKVDQQRPTSRIVRDTQLKYLDLVRSAITGDLMRAPSVSGNCTHCYSDMDSNGLQNLQECIIATVNAEVPGDFVEAGVWRGGAAILMNTISRLLASSSRRTYACDSFSGMPLAVDSHDGDQRQQAPYFKENLGQVQDNFARFKSLDDSVHFVSGFFNETLPDLSKQMLSEGRSIAILHGDAAMFASYTHILYNLYPLLSIGGFFICDDCSELSAAQLAVDEFRTVNGITEEIYHVSSTKSSGGTYWRKLHNNQINMEHYQKWRAMHQGA